MTTMERQARRTGANIELAGTVWPLFKLEAIAAGLLALVVVGLVAGSAQTAVLTAAAVSTTFWIIGLARDHRAPLR